MVTHLRHKYKKNQRLSAVTPRVQRALSWDEDKTDLATRRSSDLKLNLRAGRAKTVDYSPIHSAASDKVSSPPVFGLEDTVFEVEDEIQEGKPLLTNNNKTVADASKHPENEHKHVTFRNPGDDDVVPQNVKTVTDKAKMEGPVNKPGPSRSQSSQHSAHLHRQDAMKDPDSNVDIQMQDLGKDNKEKPNRQMSV